MIHRGVDRRRSTGFDVEIYDQGDDFGAVREQAPGSDAGWSRSLTAGNLLHSLCYLRDIAGFHKQIDHDPDDHCAEETFPSLDEGAEADAEEVVEQGVDVVEAVVDGVIVDLDVSLHSYIGRL